MYVNQIFLFNLTIVLAANALYLFLVVCVLRAVKKGREKKMQRIMKMQQNAEEKKVEMRMNAENYERVGRYEEAAILYEESGELEKARQCRMLADYMYQFNQ